MSREEVVRALDQLSAAELNFTPPTDETVVLDGWQIDEYWIDLPSESPGSPLRSGSWETACSIVVDYLIADPSILRAAWDRGEPLERRTILLEGRFLWMRFVFGVRSSGPVEQAVEVDGEEVCLWRWSYQTLEGHLEKGQMDYEVWKWTASGRVAFRMYAYSKPAAIPSLLVRVGFALFGRRMQKRFAQRALQRMEELVETRLRNRLPVGDPHP